MESGLSEVWTQWNLDFLKSGLSGIWTFWCQDSLESGLFEIWTQWNLDFFLNLDSLESGLSDVWTLWGLDFLKSGLCEVRTLRKLQALVYDILPSTTAVFSYATGSIKLSANEQFFVGARTVVSLLQTAQMMMMKWCLMSSDVRWHIRDKLRPMPKHGSINLYVHGSQKAR